MEVIPAIDLCGGQLVRLEQGNYARETVYSTDPARVADRFAAAGAPRLHVVDLDGAREGAPRNLPALREILAAARGVPVQVGGGIRSLESVESLLELGADRVVLGTVALEAPELMREAAERHPSRIVLGVDTRGGQVAIRGWLKTGSAVALDVVKRFEDLPLAAVLHTDIEKDGLLQGPNLVATEQLARSTRQLVIASGGVGSTSDLVALARTRVIAGAVVGSALYTGAVRLEEALEQVASC